MRTLRNRGRNEDSSSVSGSSSDVVDVGTQQYI
jgi:hypothetical protein